MDLAMGNCFVTTVKHSASGRETKTVRRLAPDLKAIIRWLERNKQYADNGEEPAELQATMNIPANLKFAADFPEKAETYAGNGDTDSQIAKRLGISPASFYNYKRLFPEFAAALDSGRRECYGRLRCQLLAMALGKCSVTTVIYRDGDLCKTTERQLPPNLKAIKYWLAAQQLSNGSEILKDDGNTGRSVKTGGVAGKSNETSAQRLSRHSEILKDDGAYGTYEAYGQKTEKNDNTSAQRLSRVSEILKDNVAGFGSRLGETVSAQELSKDSESDSAVFSQSSQYSQASQSSQYTANTVKASAQRLSKMSRKERQRLLKNRRENGRD